MIQCSSIIALHHSNIAKCPTVPLHYLSNEAIQCTRNLERSDIYSLIFYKTESLCELKTLSHCVANINLSYVLARVAFLLFPTAQPFGYTQHHVQDYLHSNVIKMSNNAISFKFGFSSLHFCLIKPTSTYYNPFCSSFGLYIKNLTYIHLHS